MAKVNTDTDAYLKAQGLAAPPTGGALPGAGAPQTTDPTPITDPDPLPEWLGNVVYPLTQAWVADIPEAGQQIAAGSAAAPPNVNIPLGPFGTINPNTLLQRATATPFRQAVRTGGDIVNVPAMAAAGPAGEAASLGAFGARVAPEAAATVARGLEWLGPAARTGLKTLFGAEAQPVEPGEPNFAAAKARQATLGLGLGAVGAKAADVVGKRDAASRSATVQAAGENLQNRSRYQQQLEDVATREKLNEQWNEQRRNMFIRERQAHGESEAQAESDYLKAMQEHGADVARETEAHRLQWEDWNKQSEARTGLDEQQNVAWMRRALDRVGLGDKTPTTPGDDALNTTRELIGDKLNEANAQLSFNAIESDAINRIEDVRRKTLALPEMTGHEAYFNALIDRTILPTIAEHDEAMRRWNEKEPLQGQDFANYVSKINGEADRLGRGAKFPNPNARAELAMADALHVISDMVEDGAQGPQAARELRDNAREGYRIYSTLSHAADPSKLSVATSTQVVNEMRRRAGTSDRYRAKLAQGDPDAAHASQWLYTSRQPLPEQPPTKPDLPSAPAAPEYRKPPEPPKETKLSAEERRAPTPPAEVSPQQPPTRTPGPWAQVRHRLMLAPTTMAGFKLGEAIGHPWMGGGIGAAVGEALAQLQGEPLQRALAKTAQGRAPYATGAAGGQVAADPTAPARWGAQVAPSALDALLRQILR